MSHKEKICNTALTSHVEICHEQHSYTPLIVSRKIWKEVPRKSGLKSIITSDLEEKTAPEIRKLEEGYLKKAKSLKSALNIVFDKESTANKKEALEFSTQELKEPTFEVIEAALKNQLDQSIQATKKNMIATSKGALDISNPEKAIEAREEKISALVLEYAGKDVKHDPIPINKTYELEGLGLFFKEAVCYRPEGFSYAPCGKEMTIMPGEEIKESNILTTILKEEDSNEQTITQDFTSTERETDTETFTESYENTLKKETDIKLAREASFKLNLPLKIFNLNLSGSSSGSVNFNKIINEVNKSSHTNTRTRFNEVIRKMNTNAVNRSSRNFTSTDKYTHIHNWKNETDTPQTYVKRTSYCKTSVIHKRHNVQLAWSGCIDNPARDLCTPNTIEEKHAAELQAIRDKWKNTSAPFEFGTEPRGKKVCTVTSKSEQNIVVGASNHKLTFGFTIPDEWSYKGGSAAVEIIDYNASPESWNMLSTPSNGARGAVRFDAQVLTKNRGLNKEWVSFKVCFNIIPDAAVEWHNRVNTWREEQAQREIDEFLAKETEKLTQFLATDQARSAIERRILQDYFGITSIEECCRLIARLRKVFDFDTMGYSLLPSWNELGEGCQKAFPVNLYTAKCLHFYLPINAGMEREAISLLASVNAIPWSAQLAPQIFAYVQQIQNMRTTLYNRLFDPVGWNVKFDQPKGYDMTKYDTTSQNWSAAHESDLNYELLGAFTINVPCGERIDKRPLLCE
jgi:hypothetical protein